MTRVLALDIAKRTGFAHDGPIPGAPIAGAFQAPDPLGSKETGLERGITLSGFRWWFIKLLSESKPDLVCMEAPLNVLKVLFAERRKPMRVKADEKDKPFGTNFETMLMLIQLCGIVECETYNLQIELAQTENRKFKKFFTGTAGGGKDPVMARCKQLGWDFGGDHNVADAMAIWAYAKAKREPQWAPQFTPLFGRKT